MKRPTFLEGVGVALAASLTGSILFSALSPTMQNLPLLKLLIAGLGLAYTLYLFRRSRERLGRLVTGTVWLFSAAVIWLLDPPLTLYLLLHIGLIWLIRSLYLQQPGLRTCRPGPEWPGPGGGHLGSRAYRQPAAQYLVLFSAPGPVQHHSGGSEKAFRHSQKNTGNS